MISRSKGAPSHPDKSLSPLLPFPTTESGSPGPGGSLPLPPLACCSLLFGNFESFSSQSGVPRSYSCSGTPWASLGDPGFLSWGSHPTHSVQALPQHLASHPLGTTSPKPRACILHRPDGAAHSHREAEHGPGDPPGGERGRCPGCGQRGLL